MRLSAAASAYPLVAQNEAQPGFVQSALEICQSPSLGLQEKEEQLAALASTQLRKGINNRRSLKLRQTDIGVVGVVPSRRNGVFILRPEAPAGERVVQCDKREQGFSGSEILQDGTVLVVNTISGGLYVARPGATQMSEYLMGDEFIGLDDSSEIYIRTDGNSQTIRSESGTEVTLHLKELAGKTVCETPVAVPEIG